MRTITLHPGDDLFSILRKMVEAGEIDGPVRVERGGRHVMSVRSLYRAALLTVSEEPRCRFVPWTPHPNATVGPRLQMLLEARAARKRAA